MMIRKEIRKIKHKWHLRYKSILRYFTYEIWYDRTEAYPYWKRIGLTIYKIISISYKKFFKDKCADQASALSFYSILAVVPILAVAFGIAKGFGLNIAMEREMDELSSQNIFWQSIFGFSKSMLDNVSGGLIAGIGLCVLMWIIMNVLTSVEIALNDIWQLGRQRTILRKFTDYTTIILLTPILITLGFSTTRYIHDNIANTLAPSLYRPLLHFLMELAPFFATLTFFTLLYLILPNRRIPFKAAFISAIVSTLFFIVFKFAYVKLQAYTTAYNVVYGSFAALPLFLIWLRISWIIVLFGAELGFSILKMDNYIFETDYKYISERRRKIYALYMTSVVTQAFVHKMPAPGIQDLARIMCIPIPYVYDIASDLTKSGVFSKIFSDEKNDNYEACYQPAFDVNILTLQQVLQSLDMLHYDDEFMPESQAAYRYLDAKLTQIHHLINQSSTNVLLKDVDFNM